MRPTLHLCLALVALTAACGGRTVPSVVVPPPAERAASDPADDAPRVAFWDRVRKSGGDLPDGVRASERVSELEAWLRSPDPMRRDRLAYEIFEAWIYRKPKLGPAELGPLADRLAQNLTVRTQGESDAVFGRSFSALVLSLIAARHTKEPFLKDTQLAAMADAARSYAHEENDLRGWVEGQGWAHPAAHTADWLKFLARARDLPTSSAPKILDAVRDFAIRRHGYAFHHGEDERLALPVLELVARGAIEPKDLARWADELAAPQREAWPEPFDPAWHAAAQNSRALLSTLYLRLSLATEGDTKSREALAALRPVVAKTIAR